MDLASLFGGGGGAPAGSPGIGGSGKGASGAATIFGNNASIGAESGNVTVIIAALAGLVLVGLIVFLIVKK
jgi:hypothetical protein